MGLLKWVGGGEAEEEGHEEREVSVSDEGVENRGDFRGVGIGGHGCGNRRFLLGLEIEEGKGNELLAFGVCLIMNT